VPFSTRIIDTRGVAAALHRDTVDVGVDAVGDEVLRAVDDVVAAIAARVGLDALHVGAGARLGDGDSADGRAVDDAGQPAALLCLGAGVENVHGGHVRVVEDGDGEAAEGGAAHLLAENDAGQLVELGAAVLGGVADAEEAEAAHAAEDLARHHAGPLPFLAVRLHLRLDKAAELVPQGLVLGGEEGGRPACRHGCCLSAVLDGCQFIADPENEALAALWNLPAPEWLDPVRYPGPWRRRRAPG
jgi:hypothetical protein